MSGLKDITFIEDLELKDKKVFIRLDLNVPMKDGTITDDTRIQGALPTIRYALEKGAKIVLCSHLGRPKTEEDRKTLSLEPVGNRLSELLNVDVQLIENPVSDAAKALLPTLRPNQIVLLENIRFLEGEEANSEKLAAKIASYVDVYINDAFGASHRAHATIVALPHLMKHKAVGYLIKKEIEMLDKILYEPQTPFVVLMGGSKVSDKIGVIENLMDKIDTFLVGGAMSYTFLQAMNVSVGNSKLEKGKINLAKDLLKRLEMREKKLLLPVDHVIVEKFDAEAHTKITDGSSIPEGWMGVDIGPKTAALFAEHIHAAGTVFWNGPMGIFEVKNFAKGSFQMAEALAKSPCISIVGGGDSASAVNASGYADQMTHISTGGGASLEYLQGDKLPGLEALRERRR